MIELTAAIHHSCSVSFCELPVLGLTVADSRFRYPDAAERYPGIAHVNDYNWVQRIALSAVPYCLWQLTYWKVSFDGHDPS